MQKTLKLFLVTLSLLGILQSNVSADIAQQTAFVERFYQNILNRSADTGGMNTWLNTIQNESATKVALGFFNSQEFANLNLSNEGFVDMLYQTLFDRQADSGGRIYWIDKLNSNTSKNEVMYGFFNGTEFKNLSDSYGVIAIRDQDQLDYNPYGTSGVNGYVNRFYTLVLNRIPDDSGFNDWTTQLNNQTKGGGDIAKGFFNSIEYTNRNLDNSTFLDIAYRAFFDREADAGGKSNWLTQLNQGASKDEVLDGFIDSQEFINLANSFGIANRLETESPIVSVILGKQITAHDSYGTVTSKFYANGNYSESGNDSADGPWSCSGKWKDLGNNKIGATCDDNGTTLLPDGIISLDGDEIHIQFNADTLSVGNRITIIGNDETSDITVDSFGDISSVTNVTVPSFLDWQDWPSMMNNAATSFDELVYGFTENGDYSYYLGSDEYDGIRLLSNGNAVLGTAWRYGYLATSNVIGSWTTSNEVIVVNLNNGETVYLRVTYKNGNYVIQNAFN